MWWIDLIFHTSDLDSDFIGIYLFLFLKWRRFNFLDVMFPPFQEQLSNWWHLMLVIIDIDRTENCVVCLKFFQQTIYILGKNLLNCKNIVGINQKIELWLWEMQKRAQISGFTSGAPWGSKSSTYLPSCSRALPHSTLQNRRFYRKVLLIFSFLALDIVAWEFETVKKDRRHSC